MTTECRRLNAGGGRHKKFSDADPICLAVAQVLPVKRSLIAYDH